MKPNTVGCVDGKDRRTGQFGPYAVLDTGLLQGANLLTLDGEIPVEFLGIGDKLVTRDSGISRVEHVQRATRSVRAV